MTDTSPKKASKKGFKPADTKVDLNAPSDPAIHNDRGIRFWRRCAAEPHCIRFLPDNQPRTRTEAILRRAVNPGDTRSHFDHKGRFMYPAMPIHMEMDAIREQRRQGLDVVRRHAEILKSIVLKDQTKLETPDMDFAAMRERLARAGQEHARRLIRQRQLPTTTASTYCNKLNIVNRRDKKV